MMQKFAARKNIHYGWVVCAACAAALFCTSGLSVNAFTVFQPYLIDHANLSNTQSSLIITVRSLMSFLSVFLIGPFYRRFTLRTGIAVAVAIVTGGFVLFGLGNSFWAYCVAAFIVGVGYGLGTMVPVTMLINRWFVDRRSFALGICAAATGLSTVGVPNLITWSVDNFGLGQTFAREALVILLCGLGCFTLVRDTPEKMGLEPYTSGEASLKSNKQRGAGRNIEGATWLLVCFALVALGAMSTVAFSHLSVLMANEGFQSQDIALAISFTGAALMAGKLLFGQLSDKRSAKLATLVFGTLSFLGLGILCLATGSLSALLSGTILYGMGVSLSSVGLMTWATDLSSTERQDQTVKTFQLLYGAGGFFLSPVPGLVADLCGGSYVPVYAVFTVLAAFVTVSILVLYNVVNRKK